MQQFIPNITTDAKHATEHSKPSRYIEPIVRNLSWDANLDR